MTRPIAELFRSSAFWGAALSTVPEVVQGPEQTPEPVIQHATNDYLMGGDYAVDGGWLPDYRHPIAPPVVEAKPMDEYAAEREAAGIRDVGDFASMNGVNASRPAARSNKSSWQVV